MPCASAEAIGRFPDPFGSMSLPSASDHPLNVPGPTPPSSTSTIPPLCFPSPTSVAHVVNSSTQPPAPAANSPNQHPVGKEPSPSQSPNSQSCQAEILHSRPSVAERDLPLSHSPPPEAKSEEDSPRDSDSEGLPQQDSSENKEEALERVPQGQPAHPPQQQSANIATHHYYYHRPELSNPSPSPALECVNKATFTAALEQFIARVPPNQHPSDPDLVAHIRVLLDHLDALMEQLALRVTNALFDVLSHPNCLHLLLFLLSDISACSTPVMTDVRRSYRYPYLVANILANGNVAIRDAFLGSVPLVTHLLSFLDGNVVLSTAHCELESSEESSVASRKPERVLVARDNPIIVGNVVQILVSYLETSPEALLQAISARPTFIPSLVNLLHIGSVPKLFSSIILERCVEDICMMDMKNVSFDSLVSNALNILSSSAIFHLLAHAFVQATQTIFTMVTEGHATANQGETYKAEQQSFNILQVYGALVNKTIRCVRLQPRAPSCYYLHVFGNAETAKTVVQILRAGIELFRGTDGEQVGTLNLALNFAIELLKYVEQDRERRVASVTGQPPPLDTSALEAELDPVLQSLMSLLIDLVGTGTKHGETRLRILELFVECQRVCSENIVGTLDRIRFGQVALKLMLMNPRNSLMQHVICRSVEAALIFSQTDAFARHWLVRSKLIAKIMTAWAEGSGQEIWEVPSRVQKSPFLSALVHMACCIQHWMAMRRERFGNRSPGRQQVDGVQAMIPEDTLNSFEVFCARTIDPIMEEEKATLGGPKPRRRPTRMSGGSLGRSFGSFGQTSGAMLRRNGSAGPGGGGNRAHLVKSASAHRFGYVAPVSTARSRFDDMFSEDDELDGGFGSSGGASSFASIFDVDPSPSL